MERELINRIDAAVKKNKKRIPMFVVEGLGALTLTSAVVNNSADYLDMSLACFSSVILASVLYYKKEKIRYRVDKYKEENEEKYTELKNIYDSYMDSLADLISTIKFDSTLELCMFLDRMMQLGYFSITDDFRYKLFKHNEEVFKDLIGTTIFTGRAVCRHNTAFMNDLLTKLNVKNFGIVNYCIGNKMTLIRVRPSTHIMTGIVENGKVSTYDFTHHTVGTIIDEKTVYGYTPIEREGEFHSIINCNHIEDYLKLKSDVIDVKTINHTFDLMMEKTNEYLSTFAEFKRETMETMEEMASKNLVLMPRR